MCPQGMDDGEPGPPTPRLVLWCWELGAVGTRRWPGSAGATGRPAALPTALPADSWLLILRDTEATVVTRAWRWCGSRPAADREEDQRKRWASPVKPTPAVSASTGCAGRIRTLPPVLVPVTS